MAKQTGKKPHNPMKYKRYADEHRREKNKLARMVRSNGYAAASAYAHNHGVLGWFQRTYSPPKEN